MVFRTGNRNHKPLIISFTLRTFALVFLWVKQLYAIVSNKSKKDNVIAMLKGEAASETIERISLKQRNTVKWVTLDVVN